MNFVAPWRARKVKQKKYCLPKEVQEETKKRNDLHKRLQLKMQCGETYLELQKEFKKQNNYCNKLIKKAVRKNRGQNITSVSNAKEIWNSINDILQPERLSNINIKIETEPPISYS